AGGEGRLREAVHVNVGAPALPALPGLQRDEREDAVGADELAVAERDEPWVALRLGHVERKPTPGSRGNAGRDTPAIEARGPDVREGRPRRRPSLSFSRLGEPVGGGCLRGPGDRFLPIVRVRAML